MLTVKLHLWPRMYVFLLKCIIVIIIFNQYKAICSNWGRGLKSLNMFTKSSAQPGDTY